jgi:hypothetical protein
MWYVNRLPTPFLLSIWVGALLRLAWPRPPQHGPKGCLAERLGQRRVGPEGRHDLGRILLLSPQPLD